MRKAQATNREIGLASLLLILLALYLYINGVNSPIKSSFKEKCALPANLSCSSLILRSNGKLDFALAQNTGVLINVTSFVCTKNSDIPSFMPSLNNSVLITSGEKAYLSGGNSGNEVFCTGRNGISVPNASSGDVYDANLYLTYNLKNGEPRFAKGTILVKYS